MTLHLRPPDAPDAGAYCRAVEAALRRAAGGPVALITGADFGVVAAWAEEGIPVAVVEQAITETAARQRGRGRPVRIRAGFLDRDVRRIEADHRERVGPRGWAPSARIRNCPRALGGCGALERGDDDRCVHCGWERP